MTAQDFRRIALGMTGATESAHMDHPDFRVNGKIFATLGYPDQEWGMVKLSPEEQAGLVRDFPDTFRPTNGAWGRAGSTLVRLACVNAETLQKALKAAWRDVSTKSKSKPSRRRRVL